MKMHNIGVNYKSITNADADIAYFKKIGINKVRIHLSPVASTTELFDTWFPLGKKFYDAGFYVINGVSVLPGEKGADAWETYASDVTSVATQLAAMPQMMSEFQIGNELELGNDEETLTDSQIRTNIRTLATTVQGILTRESISYTTSFYNDYADWASEGIGDLDFLGVNVYGNLYNNGALFKHSYMASAKLRAVLLALSPKVKITEFNLDANNDNLLATPKERQAFFMREMMANFSRLGVGDAYVYSYRGYKDQNNDFATQWMTGETQLLWDAIVNNEGRRALVN